MYKRILTAVTAIVLLCLPTAWAADTSATAAILMDGDTGEVLYEKNPDRQMLIASTTKIMTALVAMEALEAGEAALTDQVEITAAMLDGMVAQIRAALGVPDAPVVATGTLPDSVRTACATDIVYRETLVLEGLYWIWKKNTRK